MQQPQKPARVLDNLSHESRPGHASDGRIFSSKLLLFGEYATIHRSSSLNLPYPRYHGFLSLKKNPALQDENASQGLLQYCEYLQLLAREKKLPGLDLDRFRSELDQGLAFVSNIPQGYGLGSSGALCAAVYDRYARDKIGHDIASLNDQAGPLKKIFARMESFFHGESSGTDPLICYLNHAFVMGADSRLSAVHFSRERFEEIFGVLFLVNTRQARKTHPFVQLFLKRCESPLYLKKVQERFIPLTELCIRSFLGEEPPVFFEALGELSSFTYQELSPMIRPDFKDLWQEGIRTGKFLLKLCGAGGGGYVLGFARSRRDVEASFGAEVLEYVV